MKLFLKVIFFIFSMMFVIMGEAKSSTDTNTLEGTTAYLFQQATSNPVLSVIENYSANSCLKEKEAVTWRGQGAEVETNAKGQLISTSSGGRTTSYAFDTRGLPVGISSPGIVDMGYAFMAKGNLDLRADYSTGYTERFSYDPMNRLTDWTIYRHGSPLSTNSIAYHPTTGLISTKSDLGSSSVMYYGEDAQPPHALTSITGPPELIPPARQSITYTDFKKAAQITEGDHVMNITHGVSDQRIKTVLSNASGTLTRYYTGNYEEEIRSGSTRKIHYINGGNGLAALYVQNNGNDTLYYVHTDYQGNLLALSLANGTVKERYAYDPWGKRRDPLNWSLPDTRTSFLFHRGYTLHEHLPEFNLINMNGRIYDPLTAQFLGLDPYVQAPGNWVNYNRYAYAFNNPLIYTDPTGEYVGIDDLLAAVVGGLINWGVNIWQGNVKGDFWTTIGKGAAAFGAGAVGGVGALYPEFGGWAWGGATVGATNAWLGGAKGWDIAIGAGVGIASSCVGSLAGQWGAQYLGGAIINGTSITSPVLQGAITGTAGGAVGGYASGFTVGLLMTGDLSEANSSGWKGSAFGAPIGGISGFSSAYRYFVKNNIDPLNGNLRFKNTPTPSEYNYSPDPLGDNVTLYRVTTGSEGKGGPLFMTDNPDYAASYVANGGKVVEVTLPRNTLVDMQINKVLNISPKPQLHINGTSGFEYQFNSNVKPYIVPRFK